MSASSDGTATGLLQDAVDGAAASPKDVGKVVDTHAHMLAVEVYHSGLSLAYVLRLCSQRLNYAELSQPDYFGNSTPSLKRDCYQRLISFNETPLIPGSRRSVSHTGFGRYSVTSHFFIMSSRNGQPQKPPVMSERDARRLCAWWGRMLFMVLCFLQMTFRIAVIPSSRT